MQYSYSIIDKKTKQVLESNIPTRSRARGIKNNRKASGESVRILQTIAFHDYVR